MTDKPEQKQAPPAPTKGKQTKPKIKRVYRFGVFSFVFLFLLMLIIFTVTPLLPYLMSFVPPSFEQAIFKGIYQNITLEEGEKKISEPFKYEPPEPLSVLGDNTGICFFFHSTIEKENKDNISAQRLDKAARGKIIAEIIVVDDKKHEYKLEHTRMISTSDKDDNPASSVCQKFGKAYPVTPKTINKIFVRPIKPFTPYKVIWTTTKTIYSE